MVRKLHARPLLSEIDSVNELIIITLTNTTFTPRDARDFVRQVMALGAQQERDFQRLEQAG